MPFRPKPKLQSLICPSLTGTAATALAAKFAGYGETLAVAARDLAPHLICVYLKELAADFHTFYNAETRARRQRS